MRILSYPYKSDKLKKNLLNSFVHRILTNDASGCSGENEYFSSTKKWQEALITCNSFKYCNRVKIVRFDYHILACIGWFEPIDVYRSSALKYLYLWLSLSPGFPRRIDNNVRSVGGFLIRSHSGYTEWGIEAMPGQGNYGVRSQFSNAIFVAGVKVRIHGI